MASYYFNNNVDDKGKHEVHISTCSHMPATHNQIYIGEYTSCSLAITSAKTKYPAKSFDGCYYCCNQCHTG